MGTDTGDSEDILSSDSELSQTPSIVLDFDDVCFSDEWYAKAIGEESLCHSRLARLRISFLVWHWTPHKFWGFKRTQRWFIFFLSQVVWETSNANKLLHFSMIIVCITVY